MRVTPIGFCHGITSILSHFILKKSKNDLVQGIVIRTVVKKPKKPNSANRKVRYSGPQNNPKLHVDVYCFKT